MIQVDFFISNNNHHWQIVEPLIDELLKLKQYVRVISLCELRRMPTPDFDKEDVEIIKVIKRPVKGLKTSSGAIGLGGNRSIKRNILRFIYWHTVLKFRLLSLLQKKRPSIVVLPNDVAYPYNFICRELKHLNIKFLLIQEGIRFPLPNEKGGPFYGSNGASAVLTWGQKSAEYFKELGCRTEITGCPRYDKILANDYYLELQLLESRYKFSDFNILFASNPIDDQGFCTFNEKIQLFKNFIIASDRIFPRGYKIFVKLHPRENVSPFQSVVNELAQNHKVVFVKEVPLFALLKKVQLTVIFASTIGLESLIFGVQLCVIKLPGHGYQFDYVSSGVALPLDLDNISEFKWKKIPPEVMSEYCRQYLAFTGQSTAKVVDVILKYS